MNVTIILALVKSRLGISTTVRDTYLSAIIDGIVKELEDEKGLLLDSDNAYHLIFVCDYVSWRYESKDSILGMPRHLQFRLHNLLIHVGNKNLQVDGVELVVELPVTPLISTVYILADGSNQMYVDSIWTTVDLIDGTWVIV